MKELRLDSLPKIDWVSGGELHKKNRSFGSFKNNGQVIHVEITNRHPVDIMRTLAHELVHYRQWLDGRMKPDSGKTGSNIENQAHAVTGVLMRKFSSEYIDIFELDPVMENFADGEGGGESVKEAWSEKYKKSINCNNPKGFSQRAHCAGRTESAGINEVADQPYRFMLTKKTDSGNWYMFETDNGIRMVVSATLDPLPNGTFSTEIAFSEYDAKNMDITGKGDAFRIFATVGAIVKEFLRSGKPNAEITEIYFTGKTNEPSRIKLYDMIAKNINRFLTNFEFKNTVGNAREKYYHFKKVSTASESQISENFANGKGPGKPGDSQRHGIPKDATIAQLEKAAKAPGRKGQLARWQLNMRRGKKK